MVRPNLDNLPEFALPADYGLRWFQAGDEENWLRIHLAADHYNEITPALFQRQFGTAANLLRERQCYLLDARGIAVGTGTAWFNNSLDGMKFGRAHWMAIMPEHQGRGLGKALMTTICRRLRALGHDRVYLSTSTGRLPAIRLYLRFGFVPRVGNEEEAAAWREVNRLLGTVG